MALPSPPSFASQMYVPEARSAARLIYDCPHMCAFAISLTALLAHSCCCVVRHTDTIPLASTGSKVLEIASREADPHLSYKPRSCTAAPIRCNTADHDLPSPICMEIPSFNVYSESSYLFGCSSPSTTRTNNPSPLEPMLASGAASCLDRMSLHMFLWNACRNLFSSVGRSSLCSS